MAVIGIDLGTTNSLACIWKDGETVLIPDKAGEVLTPSVVSIDKNGELLVGKAAKECLISSPEQTVCKFKRFMGTNKEYRIGRKTYSPEELSSLVLRKLKRDAEAYLGETVTEAVISVPAYFNNEQREATRRAGELAGLKTERIINEPSAAALACQVFYPSEEEFFLVIDFGGGTLDVSLVECFEQVISVVAVSGDNHLGGIDFDTAIAKHFCQENYIDFVKLTQQRREIILKSAEAAKIALTESEEAVMRVSWEGETLTTELSRESLIQIAAPVFERFIKPVERVLADSQIPMKEIGQIVLVGGSCKMPVMEMYIKYKLKRTPVYLGSPDTIVAQGVGICAAIKERNAEIKDMVLTDICPYSLGTQVCSEEWERERMSVIIERNTPLPAVRSGIYYPLNAMAKKMTMSVYQGEEYFADENVKLGEIKVEVPLSEQKEDRFVELTFAYDINGILGVTATVLSTGKKTSIVIEQDGRHRSKAELLRRQQELEKLMILPQDREENRVLIEKAKSLFAQTTGRRRKELEESLAWFLRELSGNSLIMADKARMQMEAIVASMEQSVEMGLDIGETDASGWYQQMRQNEEDNEEDEDVWPGGGGMTH